MYIISSPRLSVDIIDPVADRSLLGSRYCTGGYIFQVRDHAGQELLSGPHFGEKKFDVFDGQGAPELFAIAPNQESAGIGDEVLVIGVGKVLRTSRISPFQVRDNPEVAEFAAWEVDVRDAAVKMGSMQTLGGWRFLISRTVAVDGTMVVSTTRIENFGDLPVPVRWFAHPFFPLTPGGRTCSFSLPVRLPENAGYELDDRGFIVMKGSYDWDRGLFQKIGFDPAGALSVRQCHPVVGRVTVDCGFTPADLAVWANRNTFSFEAFYEATLRQGEASEWAIRYRFGRV